LGPEEDQPGGRPKKTSKEVVDNDITFVFVCI